MEIAPGIEDREWRALRLNDPASPDWSRAVEILSSRIYDRFIDPVDLLINVENTTPARQRRFGFAIVALDCLLIETMGAFIQGLIDTKGLSGELFRHVLMSRPRFSPYFPNEATADQFYREFRCGILHQAEVRGQSRVWSVGDMIWHDGDGLVVNRNLFHEALKAEFDSYLDELRLARNGNLRANFRNKMDFISGAQRR